jgi:predicted permease
VVVLSHGLWQRRYGGDPGVVGRSIEVDGITRVVSGIAPAGFNAPAEWIGGRARLDVWIPFIADAASESRDNRSYGAAALLRAGWSLDRAKAEMSDLSALLMQAHPAANREWTLRLTPLEQFAAGNAPRVLLPLSGVMLLLLAIACANVSQLALNRSLARSGEYAVRSAMGAGRWALVRSALLETALLVALATAMGLLIARVLLASVSVMDSGPLPGLSEARLDGRLFGATLASAALVSLLIGLLPAMRVVRVDVQSVLRSTGRTGAHVATRRARDLLAVVQLGLALAILCSTALVLRGFSRMRAAEPGFEADGLLTATVVLSMNRVPEMSRRVAFSSAVLERLRAIPGVESAAMINSLPFSGSHSQQPFDVAGRPAAAGEAPFAGLRGISPDYVRTMRIALRGREFVAADLTSRPATALVNEALVRRYLGGRDAIGQRLLLQGGELSLEVVGVVGDVRHFSLDRPPMPEIYVPYTMDYLSSKSFIVRADPNVAAVAAAVRRAILDVDSMQPLRASGPDRAETVTMRDWVDASLAAPTLNTMLLMLLALLAIALATIGLFAVVSVTVTERAREIALRIALGAGRRRVLGWVLSWILQIAAPAAVGGILLVLALGRVLEALLFGANARDPAVLGLCLLMFAVLTAAAATLPALRATRIHPARSLSGS